MSDDDTYPVELTFRDWQETCFALGLAATKYREKGMDGQANTFQAIVDEIAEGIHDDNMVHVADLRILVKEWRERGADKRLAQDHGVNGQGKGLELAADDLEAVIEGDDNE